MKKISFLLLLMLGLTAGLGASRLEAQSLLTYTVTAGTDSIQNNVDTYFYLNGKSGTTNSTLGANRVKATSPITEYGIKAIQFGTVHGAVAGSGDTTRITIEVSLDNTNWNAWLPIGTGGTLGTLVTSGGMFDYSSNYFGTLAGTAYAMIHFSETQIPCWPYVRFKFDNDATGRKFPICRVTLKKL